ncbi:MAG: hypothetical protein RL641_108 [Candidatus Parcubacteria bacterium]|jgi:glycosyltransferase involved in cell wall biosynthesis
MDTNIDMNVTTEKSLVSIIMPTYNGSARILSAIESILAQTYTNWELIIVDDGSTDDTKGIVVNFSTHDSRIIYIKNEANLGIQKSLNRGISMAKGDYIARLDDDDTWNDIAKLEMQVGIFEKEQSCVLVGTGAILVNESGQETMRYLLPATDREIRNTLHRKNCFIHSSVMFRRDIAVKLGGYEESQDLRHVEDYDFWLRMGKEGTLANISLYAVTLMVRKESLSGKNKIVQLRRILNMLKNYRDDYPGFAIGYFQAMLRVGLYSVFAVIEKIMPKKLWYYLVRVYKERW